MNVRDSRQMSADLPTVVGFRDLDAFKVESVCSAATLYPHRYGADREMSRANLHRA